MSWFEAAFGDRYLELYAHRDREEAKRALETLFPGHALAGRTVLDLACGPGRYLRVLFERGARVVGLDLSSVLLREAQRVFSTLGARPRLVRGDMRHLPFRDRRFDLTLSMFTSFGYFDTEQEHADLALEMARVTGAVIVLDIPDPARLAATLVPRSERRWGDHRIVETRRIEASPRRVVKEIDVFGPGGVDPVEHFEERVMLFEACQIEDWFGRGGFLIEDRMGAYDGSAYRPGVSERQLLRLRRDRVV